MAYLLVASKAADLAEVRVVKMVAHWALNLVE
jgi:hypothetical protein